VWWYLCRLYTQLRSARRTGKKKIFETSAHARVCEIPWAGGGEQTALRYLMARPYIILYRYVRDYVTDYIPTPSCCMCTRPACVSVVILLCTYTHVCMYLVYIHIIYLPKYIRRMCIYNIIMCRRRRRRKHLGTAEDDRAVKVRPITCTGCSGKTGKYETIVKEVNKRKMYKIVLSNT